MSIAWMESFAGFPSFSDPTWTNDQHAATRDALQAAGYVYAASSDPATVRMRVMNDPVIPSRSTLTVRLPAGTGQYTLFGRKLPATPYPLILGFSFYVPAEAPDATGTSTWFQVSLRDRNATTRGSNTETDLFSISQQWSITVNGAVQSALKPKKGAVNYFEIQFMDGQARVWMNDALVGQRAVSGLLGQIALSFICVGTIATDISIGNMYLMAVDDIAPNVRLGPTTRVIGKRPAYDESVMFQRPSGPASNAEVVAQDLKSSPTMSLQSETPGDEDFYSGDSSNDILNAPMVHAVGVKVYGANFDAVEHSLAPVLKSGLDESEFTNPLVFKRLPAFTTANLTCLAIRPTTGEIVIGDSSGYIWSSSDDGATWQSKYVGYNLTEIAFLENGNGVAFAQNGYYSVWHWCPHDQPAVEWISLGNFLGSGWTNVQGIAVIGDYYYVTRDVTGSPDIVKIHHPEGSPPVVDSYLGTQNSYTVSDLAYSPETDTIIAAKSSQVVAKSVEGEAFTLIGLPVNLFNLPRIAYGNGTWLLIGTPGQASSYYVLRSVDEGESWTNVFSYGSTLGPAADVEYVNGMFYVLGQSMRIGCSVDGLSWSVLPNFLDGANTNFSRIKRLDNKRAVLIGSGGCIAILDTDPAAKALAPLSGYQMMLNVASKDPATGSAWSSSAADDVQFGMRVVS